MRIFIIPIEGPLVQKSFDPAKALRAAPLRALRHLSIAALVAVAVVLALWPPHLWPPRAERCPACMLSLLAMAALLWSPHAMVRGTYRAIGDPIFARVAWVTAIGSVAATFAFVVLLLGELRYPPLPVCLAASLALLAGNLAIIGSGLASLGRLGEIRAPEYRVGPLLRPPIMILGIVVLTAALFAFTVARGTAGPLDWRFIVPLLGLIPTYLFAMAWCLKVRGKIRLMTGPEGDWISASMAFGVIGGIQMALAFLTPLRELWLIAAVLSAGSMMYALNNALYG